MEVVQQFKALVRARFIFLQSVDLRFNVLPPIHFISRHAEHYILTVRVFNGVKRLVQIKPDKYASLEHDSANLQNLPHIRERLLSVAVVDCDLHLSDAKRRDKLCKRHLFYKWHVGVCVLNIGFR